MTKRMFRLKPPRKRTAFALLLAAFLLLPGAKMASREYEGMLARTLYAMAAEEPYEVMIALGSLAMNRVAAEEYPGTLTQVLNEGEFFRGGGYDGRALNAAREVLSGRRSLPDYCVRFDRASEGDGFFYGSFHFY